MGNVFLSLLVFFCVFAIFTSVNLCHVVTSEKRTVDFVQKTVFENYPTTYLVSLINFKQQKMKKKDYSLLLVSLVNL